jgi:hypothetical protein
MGPSTSKGDALWGCRTTIARCGWFVVRGSGNVSEASKPSVARQRNCPCANRAVRQLQLGIVNGKVVRDEVMVEVLAVAVRAQEDYNLNDTK